MAKSRSKVSRAEVKPDARWVYIVIAVLALAGLADATYLAVVAWTGETAVCGNATGCFQVLGSSYAKMGPIPLGALGALAYFAAFSLATLGAAGNIGARRLLPWLVGCMLAMTLWLLFVQAILLHAFCRYCLFSAAVTFLLSGLIVAIRPAR